MLCIYTFVFLYFLLPTEQNFVLYWPQNWAQLMLHSSIDVGSVATGIVESVAWSGLGLLKPLDLMT